MDTLRSVLFIISMCALIFPGITEAEDAEPLPEEFLLFLEEWVDQQGDVVIPEEPELVQGRRQTQEDTKSRDIWLGDSHD
ncbi:hypothetical protein ACJJIW_13035 [Microbulbifer sp. JMSA004]|uniref:hypothetical protein n=1 Tax=unclassified Microbulbifer TaxID=2619833 RepID=UPI0024AD9EB5|nr:hypothetical protein [Microbulbifer sp. VAAF005]WHI46226.1 hypothetical protein P0078_21305 [Microbulbifer sp. VAAF005]